ncbi:hypothetical protein [Mycobacterium sp.]|uniref:hypothetical protein n=1 Tax=Mycobacterium sp. TaxID=1785 RepID=UPI003BB00F08
MGGADDDGTRDRHTVERDLRLLASVRSAYRQRGGPLPSISQMDALLDELLELSACGEPQQDNGTPGARPSRSSSR